MTGYRDRVQAGRGVTVAAEHRVAPPSHDRRWRAVESRMRRLGGRPDALIEARARRPPTGGCGF